ncbi:MAG: glycosyltransferase, partial [Candidatus Paceibacteria bacterium]
AKSGHRVWIITTSPFGWAYEEKDPADFFIYRLRGWKNPFRRGLRVSLPSNVREVRRFLDELKPDIIHLQDPAVLSRMIQKEAKRRGIPVIIHHHFSMEFVLAYFKRMRFFHIFVRAFIEHRVHKLYNQCEIIITPTEFVKHGLAKWGVKTPIVAISNGIELSRFHPGDPGKEFFERFGISQEDKIVLYLGRLDKDKNIFTLIKAIPLILEKAEAKIPNESIKFVFVGEGTERKKLQAKINRYPWCNLVKFLGFIPYEDEAVPKIYQASDLYWTASTIETQSLTTLEAMATGLPAVAANAGALPEIVHENQNGFLIEPYNAEGFAEAVVQILSNPELSLKFSKRSIEIASEHDIKKSFSRICQIYEEIIKRKTGYQRAKSAV